MSGWQAGDLAQYVEQFGDDYFAGLKDGLPILGLTYTVTAVRAARDCYGREGTALQFAEIARPHPAFVGYNAKAFRKVEPYKADEFDQATITQYLSPVTEPVGEGDT